MSLPSFNSRARHDESARVQVAVRVVTDFTEYPHDYLPQTIQRAAEIIGLTKDGQWANGAWDSLVSCVDVLRSSAVMTQRCIMCRHQCAWGGWNGWAFWMKDGSIVHLRT